MGEMRCDAAREHRTFETERERSEQAHQTIGPEVSRGLLEHLVGGRRGIGAVSQGLEHVVVEPLLDVVEDGLGHLLLSTRKVVVEATFPQAGLFADDREG